MKAAAKRPVALAMSAEGGLLVTGNGLQIPVALVEGRFPECDKVLPVHPARCQMAFDPKLMASLCQVAADLGLERVDLLYFEATKPVGLIGHNDQGQYFDALIMPLS
jgi:hypothetical protein